MSQLINRFQNINKEEEEKAIEEKASSLGLGYVNFSKTKVQKSSLGIIAEEIARRLLIVCFFSVQNKIRIAVVDEKNSEINSYLQKLKSEGYAININLTSIDSINIALENYNSIKKTKKISENIEIKRDDDITEESEEKEENNENNGDGIFKSQELLKEIYIGSIKNKSSDIHIEPFENEVLIRLRIDGSLRKFKEISKKEYLELSRIIKHKAKLTINRSDLAQDGEYQIEVNNGKIDLRVSILPAKYGEDIVIRLLDPINAKVELSNLGFLDFQKEIIERNSEKKQGLALVTGPTGSGKTSTLYSVLNKINTPDKKIITLEDPVEYEVKGLIQSNITENLSFSDGLKAALRQDPDIIMLGEIRDGESAKIALQASITGHSVLTTLHTNSSLESIFRLKNLGLKDYLIASSINLIIGQRLLRKNCPHCTEKKELDEKYKSIIKNSNLNVGVKLSDLEYEFKGQGCEECGNSGYLGREIAAEVLEFDDEIRKMIIDQEKYKNIKEYLKNKKFISIQDVALAKAIKGTTSFGEALSLF